MATKTVTTYTLVKLHTVTGDFDVVSFTTLESAHGLAGCDAVAARYLNVIVGSGFASADPHFNRIVMRRKDTNDPEQRVIVAMRPIGQGSDTTSDPDTLPAGIVRSHLVRTLGNALIDVKPSETAEAIEQYIRDQCREHGFNFRDIWADAALFAAERQEGGK